MNILLVNPPRFKGISVIREERCEITERYSVLPPYSLLQIGAILRENRDNVQLIDANGFNIPYSELKRKMSDINYDIIIFRFTPTTFDNDMKIANISKEINPDVRTIGICFTLRTLPRDVLKNAKNLDIYIMHEYEVVTPELIDAIENQKPLSEIDGIAYRENGEIKVNKPAEPIKDYDSLPIPAFDLLPNLKPYFINTPAGQPFTIMYTSKGCPYQCVYCTVAGTKWKHRSAESVLKELRYLKSNYDIKTVSFFDETFTINRKRAIDIALTIKKEKLDITWYCNTRVNLVDQELLKIMREGGCRGISYGIESGSQKILDNAVKNITLKQAENAIKWAKEVGIKTYCSFMFGLPGETWETVNETINFVKKTLPTSAQFNVAVPYPGTKLYEEALKTRMIENLDWRKLYQHEAIMGTDELSPDDLNKARNMAYKALYTNPKWIAQNVGHIIKNPEDFKLATRYGMKIMNNFLFHGMKHCH